MNCQGIGRILGHKYEARYDEVPPEAKSLGNVETTARGIQTFIKALTSKTYRGDVCTRCGHIVNSPKEQK